MTKGFLVRGNSTNPHHLSIGAVILEDKKVILLKKGIGIYTLPRETMYSQESLEETLIRGVEAEIGIIVKVEKYIGALITHFPRLDNTLVEKTTLYFLVSKISESVKDQTEDEKNDEVVSLDINEAIEILKSEENEEYKILERLGYN